MSEISDYDRAISAYQFQVDRYHTWMNYYSIFEGALLVAFYSIDRCKVGDLVYMLIPILGFIVSLCWLGSIVGHRCWMNSWLDIVKYLENNDNTIKYKIYKYYSANQKKVDFLSTQKITQIFITTIIISWLFTTYNYLCIIDKSIYYYFILSFIGVITTTATILYLRTNSYIHSNMKNMEELPSLT